jgi:hypothetical protein
MQQHMVRAVVTTKYGCKETTAWYPEGSPEGIKAAESLVLKRTGDFTVGWEDWDEVYLKLYRRKILGRSFCQTSLS